MAIVLPRLALVVALSGACSAREATPQGGADGSVDTDVDSALADTTRADSADAVDVPIEAGNDAITDVRAGCCEISPTPMCCMYFGGSADAGSCIGMVCDMIPTDLVRRVDESGCPFWYNPPGGTTTCNPFGPDGGGPPP